MKFHTFSPKKTDVVHTVETYTALKKIPSLRSAVSLFEQALRGTKSAPHKQSAWMGRGSFQQLGTHSFSYLIGKGIGPGAGSEEMRQLLDDLWKKRAGDLNGGCIRLETDTYYPLLLQYKQNSKDAWVITDPRPEGSSIFGAVLREAEAGEVYAKLGLDVVAPVRVYRNKITPPWGVRNGKQGLVAYIKKHTAKHLSIRHPHENITEKNISVENLVESGYWQYDSGILLRYAKTPYRIVNLHFALIDNDRELLETLTAHTRKALRETITSAQGTRGRNTDMELVKKLGSLSGQMFSNGIIHGQLHIHYQNVSVVGELADLDATIFLPSFLKRDAHFPLPALSHKAQKLFDAYPQTIIKKEKEFGIQMMRFVLTDLRTYTGSQKQKTMQKKKVAMYTLGQIYDLYNHALKAYDLLGRSQCSRIQKKGTILTKDEMNMVRTKFISEFLSIVKAQQGVDFLQWSLDNGEKSLISDYLDKHAETSIYGWHKPSTPVNHLLVPYNDQRIAFVRNDALKLLEEIKSQLDIHA